MKVRAYADEWSMILRGRSLETQGHNVQMIGGFVERFGDRELEQLTTFELRRWAEENAGAVRYVKTFLSDAVADGLLEVSPAAGLKGAARRARGRDQVPSLADVDRLRDSRVGLITESFAWTGLRLSELVRLTPLDGVQGAQTGRLTVVGKGGKVRTALVLERGRTALAAAATLAGGSLLFSTPRGKAWDRHTLGKLLRPVFRELEVSGSAHSLRHFCATWLLDHGASPLDVAVTLGHFDKDGRPNAELVLRCYGHPSHEEALRRLEGLS